LKPRSASAHQVVVSHRLKARVSNPRGPAGLKKMHLQSNIAAPRAAILLFIIMKA
jgi:hypothetical protein